MKNWQSGELTTVSVVCLTYNHEQYIAETIESFLSQETDFGFEIIIGEDCSTDNTLEIVNNYKKAYPRIIKVISGPHNVGVDRNFGRTLGAARGNYITFCDGDDYWHDTKKLQIQVDFLEKNSSYGMTHSNFRVCNVKTGKLTNSYYKRMPKLDDSSAYNDILTSRRKISSVTVCVRKDIWLDIMRKCPECSEGLYLVGDFQCWLEISRVSKVKYMQQSLATQNALPESLSFSGNPEKNLNYNLSIQALRHHYLSKYEVPTKVRKKVMVISICRVLHKAYLAKRYDIMDAEIKCIWRHSWFLALSFRVVFILCKIRTIQKALEIVYKIRNFVLGYYR